MRWYANRCAQCGKVFAPLPSMKLLLLKARLHRHALTATLWNVASTDQGRARAREMVDSPYRELSLYSVDDIRRIEGAVNA
jgi:hypothetical protein